MTTPKFLSSAAALLAAVSMLPACSSTLSGTSSSYLMISALDAASVQGSNARTFSSELESDVCVHPDNDPISCSVFEDVARVTMTMALKNPGSQLIRNVATELNFITVTRYHVTYIRADGRNTPGLDVPYGFDGGVTFTVGLAGTEASFPVVRVQAKEESPLRALRNLGGAIAVSTIAQITFYGTDQTGRAVSVTGNLNVNFADWADPPGGGE